MRSNPSRTSTNYQLSAEIYRLVRNAGFKAIVRYKDKDSGLKASIVVCDEDWNILAVGLYQLSDKVTPWDEMNIPTVKFYAWEDVFDKAQELIELARRE